MNQVKIGKFIAKCRTNYNLTQNQLAEKLNITSREISKWENGIGMPDFSIMLDLCNELNISIDELLAGEVSKTKENLSKLIEEKNKQLMASMWTILLISICFYIMILIISIIFVKNQTTFAFICGISTLIFLISGFIALKFEVDAGYYECRNCHYKFISNYKEVMMAMHMGTTRYLKCPKCHKRTWSKKSMSK